MKMNELETVLTMVLETPWGYRLKGYLWPLSAVISIKL